MNIFINRLRVEGEEYKRTFKFDKGINIIQGEFHSGKSLLLNLINYALGKEEGFKPNVQVELNEYCNIVFLEVYLGQELITLKRNLWKEKEYIEMYFCNMDNIDKYAPKILTLSELGEYLLNSLGIPQFKLLKHKQHSYEKTLEVISFRDIMRYVYINQHELGTKFFMKMNEPTIRNKNKYIFDILFNFIEFDENDILEEIKNVTNLIEKYKREKEGLNAYIVETNIYTKSELENSFNNCQIEINELKEQKRNMLKDIRNNQNKTDSIYSKVVQKINQITEAKKSINEQIVDLDLTIKNKIRLLSSYYEELKELQATQESFEKLPIEKHEYICPICLSKVEFDSESSTKETIREVILNLNNRIRTLEKSKERANENKNTLVNQNVLLEEEIHMFNKALEGYSKEIDAPYVTELETINNLIIDVQNQMNKNNELIRIFNKIEEKNSELFKQNEKLDGLKKKRDELKIDIKDKKSIISTLNVNYRDLMNNLDIQTNENNCYINDNNYFPLYKNANIIEHDSGGILECMQISYLVLLADYKKVVEDFNHPGFLMFDTLGKYLGTYLQERNLQINEKTSEEFTQDMIMDKEIYENIYKLLIKKGENIQILIGDNTPPTIAKSHIKYTFYNHDYRGLIDLDKNEKFKDC